MTCIVGMIDPLDGSVVLGADSRGTDSTDPSYQMKTLLEPKIFTKEIIIKSKSDNKGVMIIGSSGSLKVGQQLQYHFKPPFDFEGRPFEYLVKSFVPEVVNSLSAVKTQFSENDEEVKNIVPDLIIAYKGRLFEVQSDYTVMENPNGYSAIGSGSKFALGFLSGLKEGLKTMSMCTKKLVLTALLASQENCATVGPPYYLASLNTDGTVSWYNTVSSHSIRLRSLDSNSKPVDN